MSHSAQYIIQFYQKHISPYKGFRCAHGAYYGGDSCSGAVSKIIRRKGLINGFEAIKNQFRRCSHAYKNMSLSVKYPRKKKKNHPLDHNPPALDFLNCVPLPCDCLFIF